MRTLWLLVLALAILSGGVIATLAVSGGDGGPDPAIRASAAGESDEEAEGGFGPAEPDDYFLFQRSTGGKLPSAGDFRRAVSQARALRSRSAPPAGEEWALEGPTNIGGRLVDLVVDRTRPDTIYVAAATGGVWKTTDAGTTLEQAWPEDASQSMGAIAQGADGRIWAGTGELNPGGGSITFGGTGIYTSDDGGASGSGADSQTAARPGASSPIRRTRTSSTSRPAAPCSTPAASGASTSRPTAAGAGIWSSPRRRRSPAAPTS